MSSRKHPQTALVQGRADRNVKRSPIFPCNAEVNQYVCGLRPDGKPTWAGVVGNEGVCSSLYPLAACQALPNPPAKPGVKSWRVNTPLGKGNLNAQATRIIQRVLLPLLLPQKFINDVTDGNGSLESISALLQFVLS